MEEVWKDIKGYEGLYQVSNLGNVRSIERKVDYRIKGTYAIKPSILLKPSINKNGYLSVALSKNNKIKRMRVNRLVALNFISNPNKKPQVNHIDGNKSNNNVNNLEWCTNSENQLHAYKSGLHKIQKGIECHSYGLKREKSASAKKVVQYDKNLNIIKVWDCMSSACDELKISNSLISRCCHNKKKTAGGFIWRFKIEEG